MPGIVARRYAEALFELAKEKGKLAETAQELQEVVEFVRQTPGFPAWLASYRIPPEAKKELLEKVVGPAVSPWVRNFLFLLVDRRREAYLEEIQAAFQELYDQERGVLKAKVKSAVPLSPELKESLEARLREVTGREVSLEMEVDPALLGGLVIKVGNRVIDGSLKTSLARLKESMCSLEL